MNKILYHELGSNPELGLNHKLGSDHEQESESLIKDLNHELESES